MYYLNNGKVFTSKVKTLYHCSKTGLTPNLYYYDEIYDRIDWSNEPSETLDYYYREQAQRIRDSHDYVILAYSGGYDSTNILETFHYNNIKLDKIVTVGAFSQDSRFGSDENHNGEIYYNVFPTIEKLGLSNISQKIDYTEYFEKPDLLSITQYTNEWIHEIGGWFSPHHWFWRDIEKFVVPEKMRNKKVALIFGKDKPSLLYENGNYGFRFRDTPITSYGNLTSTENFSRISFYWDHTNPNILMKQLHVLKHYVTRYGKPPDVNKVVYNLKHTPIFKSPKSKTPFLSLRDQYLREQKNNRLNLIYESGLKKLRAYNYTENQVIYSKFYKID